LTNIPSLRYIPGELLEADALRMMRVMFRKIFDPPIHRDHPRWIERAPTEDAMCGEPADLLHAGAGCTAKKGHASLHAIHLSADELYSIYSPDLATLSLPREEMQGEIILVGAKWFRASVLPLPYCE
jgi:hypothetical protein